MAHIPRKSSSSLKPCQVLLHLFQAEGQEQNPGSCDLHRTVSSVPWSWELYCSGCILWKSSLRLGGEQGWSLWVPLELSDAELPCTPQQCDTHRSCDCTEPCWTFFSPSINFSSKTLLLSFLSAGWRHFWRRIPAAAASRSSCVLLQQSCCLPRARPAAFGAGAGTS